VLLKPREPRSAWTYTGDWLANTMFHTNTDPARRIRTARLSLAGCPHCGVIRSDAGSIGASKICERITPIHSDSCDGNSPSMEIKNGQ